MSAAAKCSFTQCTVSGEYPSDHRAVLRVQMCEKHQPTKNTIVTKNTKPTKNRLGIRTRASVRAAAIFSGHSVYIFGRTSSVLNRDTSCILHIVVGWSLSNGGPKMTKSQGTLVHARAFRKRFERRGKTSPRAAQKRQSPEKGGEMSESERGIILQDTTNKAISYVTRNNLPGK